MHRKGINLKPIWLDLRLLVGIYLKALKINSERNAKSIIYFGLCEDMITSGVMVMRYFSKNWKENRYNAFYFVMSPNSFDFKSFKLIILCIIQTIIFCTDYALKYAYKELDRAS